MKLNSQKVARAAEEREITITTALARAGVSRTAYYSLARRESVLPRTVRALAEALGIEAGDLLDPEPAVPLHERRLRRARAICARRPALDFHHVWHTLALLELSPLERLEGSLRRGRAQAD